MSNIKLGKYEDAAPLLEIIFYIREKLVTICHVSVLECLIELVACLAQVEVLFTIFLLSIYSKFKIIKMANQNNYVVCHFNNGKTVVLHYYRDIRLGCFQSGSCKLGIIRSFSLVFFTNSTVYCGRNFILVLLNPMIMKKVEKNHHQKK